MQNADKLQSRERWDHTHRRPCTQTEAEKRGTHAHRPGQRAWRHRRWSRSREAERAGDQ